MSDKKKTPEKKENKVTEQPTDPKETLAKKITPKPSPKRTVNIFMVIILLIIAGGIYLHQNGYITKYYPLVKSKFSYKSPLESDLISDSSEETKASNESEDGQSIPETNPPEPRSLVSSPEEHPEIAALQDRLRALEEKVLTLSNRATSLPISSENQGTDRRFLKTFSDLQDLRDKIQQGLPFATELDVLKTTLSEEDFEALKEFSPIGVPTFSYLLKDFKKVARLLNQEEAFQNATTVLEKGKAFLGQLIHMEKTNSTSPEKNSQANTSKRRLRQGDVAGVIKDIEALNQEDETIILWLSHAKAYDIANTILTRTKQALFAATN